MLDQYGERYPHPPRLTIKSIRQSRMALTGLRDCLAPPGSETRLPAALDLDDPILRQDIATAIADLIEITADGFIVELVTEQAD